MQYSLVRGRELGGLTTGVSQLELCRNHLISEACCHLNSVLAECPHSTWPHRHHQGWHHSLCFSMLLVFHPSSLRRLTLCSSAPPPGGGLGGTRRGGADVNIRHSGRDDTSRYDER